LRARTIMIASPQAASAADDDDKEKTIVPALSESADEGYKRVTA